MKRLAIQILAFGLILTMATTAFGQTAGPKQSGQKKPGQGRALGAQRLERMFKSRQLILDKLNLTAAQKAKVKELDAKAEKSYKSLLDQNKAARQKPSPEVREKALAILKEHRSGFEKVLTAEQKKKYRELMKARREEMRKKRDNQPRP